AFRRDRARPAGVREEPRESEGGDPRLQRDQPAGAETAECRWRAGHVYVFVSRFGRSVSRHRRRSSNRRTPPRADRGEADAGDGSPGAVRHARDLLPEVRDPWRVVIPSQRRKGAKKNSKLFFAPLRLLRGKSLLKPRIVFDDDLGGVILATDG